MNETDPDGRPSGSGHESCMTGSGHELDPSWGGRAPAVRRFVAARGRPSSLDIVTLDDRLAAAARKEGFEVVPVPGIT
jgi:hypothetical protein